MGQAKRRGTYEERKESAIHDANVVREILLKQEKLWWDSLTEEEQKNIISKRTKQLCSFKGNK